MRDGVESLCDQVIDGRFRVVCPIGQGGMGIVWRVQHIRTKQLFALKTLHGSALRQRRLLGRVLHEARATAAVQSKHVVRIVDVNPDYEHRRVELPFIVMELLRGQNFSDLLGSSATIEASELVWIMRQVSRGLEAAHERGIIHCDLKPSNIFLSRDEDHEIVVKLCDFGIAKLQASARAELEATSALSTETGIVLGTPRYMAPEQLRRHGKVSPATDEWAFAQIAFRALSGRDYFEHARSGTELTLAIAHDPLPLPSNLSHGIPQAFDDWFMRSCAREPGGRYPNVAVQLAEMERALGSPTPTCVAISAGQSCGPEGAGKRFAQSFTTSVPVTRGPRYGLAHRVSLAVAAALAAVGTWCLPQLSKLGGGAGSESTRIGVLASSGSVDTPPVVVKAPSRLFVDAASGETSHSQSGALPPPTSKVARRDPLARKNSAHLQPSLSVSARPVTTLLSRGASCTRSSQCAEGLCAAEACQ